MKHSLLLTIIIATFSTSLASTAFSETPPEEKPSLWKRIFGTSEKPAQEAAKEKNEGVSDKAKDKESKDAFTKEEREVLESWQKGKAKWKQSKKPLPPGLQKKVDRGGELPPGWKKKLEIGEALDPELEKAALPLPEEILKRLPKTPDGTDIIQIGDEIVRIYENSREIIDIIGDVTSRGD